MSKECQLCAKENIGCDSIQKIMRDIDDLKKAKAHRILMLSVLSLVLVFIIICFFIYNNMLRQPIMVQQMPESQLKDLSELFNAQFSNLLTVMGGLITIIGFILPLINLYYQRQTLKEERESLKREVDRNLEIINNQVKNFDLTLQQAKEERRAEINNLRDELAQAIDAARKNFQSRQDDINKKLNDYDIKLKQQERTQTFDKGYFMHQLAMSAQNINVAAIYYSNALPYFSKICDSKDIQERVDILLNGLTKVVNELTDLKLKDEDYIKNILENIEEAKQNLINNYYFASKIDEIKNLIEKKKNGKVSSEKK